ncbi:MAG: MarR family winged helix-turn-helix transcriptional regulator [Gammaproteobacteria bacterium]
MQKQSDSTNDNVLESRVEKLAQYMLLLRKMQDKTGAEFLASLGGLSMQEVNVLNIIGDFEPCIMSDIAKHAALSLSSVTVIVDKLVKANLVVRIRSEQDRRIVHGSLTADGKKIYQIQIQHMHEVLRKLLSSLSIEEQENFLKIFQKITRAPI